MRPPEESQSRVSIALCTFNGEPYIRDQLASLLKQTYPPLEIVVSDDGSTDGTLALVERFAEESQTPVVMHRNPSRLGPAANFAAAISACGGEVIALCDQDDIWAPEKLELSVDLLHSTGAGFVFSDAEVVDPLGNPKGFTLFEAIGFSDREQQRLRDGRMFEVQLKHNVVTGATLVFRRDALPPKALEMPVGWLHDAWLATILSISSTGCLAGYPLIRYRQHGGNVVGATRFPVRKLTMGRAALDVQLQNYARGWVHLEHVVRGLAPAGIVEQIRAKQRYLESRIALPGARIARVPWILNLLVRRSYARYGRGWRTAVQDLVV